MSLASLPAVTTDFVNSDVSGGRWTSTRWLHSSTPLWIHGLITATLCFAGAHGTVTDKLQCVLNAAARVVTGTWKFDRGLGQILHDELHWLDVPDRVFLKLAVTVHRCLNGCAPPYLSDYCVPAAGVDTRQHLRSANRQLLAVPRYRLNTYGRRAFSATGPKVWTSLPGFIRDPTIRADCFRRLLKIYLFARY